MSEGVERRNPFVGLRPFDDSDSLYFFGRRAPVADLLQQLHQTRFLSGVGSLPHGKVCAAGEEYTFGGQDGIWKYGWSK